MNLTTVVHFIEEAFPRRSVDGQATERERERERERGRIQNSSTFSLKSWCENYKLERIFKDSGWICFLGYPMKIKRVLSFYLLTL